MKKTLLLMIALFILSIFSAVSAHGNQDNLLSSNHRIVVVNDPQALDSHDPQQPYPPQPQPPQLPQPQPPESPQPQPQVPDQHDPH
ncbi:hypothetical protein UFO1_0223 [Pelosinus sp. UFO1]|nr:hypothetical protein UFO1_0223 [Pelosinus sp. UFO1]